VRETPSNDARGARLIPSDAYSAQEKACHSRFRDVCEEYASFRVVLLAGVPAGEGFKEKYKPKSVKINELDVWLHLVVLRGKITRIGVSMPHPEAFLRALSGKVRLPYKVAARLDNAINTAVTLAGIDLRIAEKYFSAFLLNRYSGPETVLDFDESPMSALMEGRRKEIDTGTKVLFQDLPLSVIRYVTKERKLNSLEDVENTLRPNKPDDTYLLNAHRIMHAKSYETRKVQASSKRSESSVPFERTTQTKSDMSISTVCEGCGKYAVEDTSPIFGTEGPVKNIYITRSTERCPTGCSNPKPGKKSAIRLDLIPVDKNIAYMSQKRFRALVQAAKKAQEKATEGSQGKAAKKARTA
jgi:predicted nucleic acid-binding protein